MSSVSLYKTFPSNVILLVLNYQTCLKLHTISSEPSLHCVCKDHYCSMVNQVTLLHCTVFFSINSFSRWKEMFYLTTHSTHFIYGYMASDIWLRTILIVRKETRCRHIGYSFRLTARVLLYAPSHRQDSTYHGLCYTSHGSLAGTRNSSMGPPHEGSIRRPIAP